MTDRVECVVVGAGVVGLAIARELVVAGREVMILEAADTFGTGISSRNSEVIHAGIYYPAGSLKARLCVRGRGLLYRYCADHAVPHDAIGKLIVATCDDQRGRLAALADAAIDNGVNDIRAIDADEIGELEPEITAVAGLLSPSTGIVDAAALMRALLADATGAGSEVAYRSRVTGARCRGGALEVDVDGAGSLACDWLINAAGLGAQEVGGGIEGLAAGALPDRYLAKGTYFRLAAGPAPCSRLVYPLPVDGGLGVHLTLDLAGNARFDPDVQWIDDPDVQWIDGLDYTVNVDRVPEFVAAIERYWPAVTERELVADYAGIRPKLGGPGSPAADFRISTPADHGVPGLINLFGIESPGLTSSLAIAELVGAQIAGT